MSSSPKDGTENIELENRAGGLPSDSRTKDHATGSSTDGHAAKGPPEDTRPKIGERERLEGFAAVEHEMMKHDEGTMEGHAKDVDTLLVFAGLFSAVLTAFAVESYKQLQVDTNQKSMFLLQRISIQLESFTLSPGFANCSTKPPLPSLDFVADVTARWINILWFLSLIFSLAAALFGILVKQWIREYMQWNSALASPRENVLVRQVRFEAWNKWNVPATIAAVPALLEIALVLYVCGLVVLLWTLDAVVSIVITTAVGVFLAAASTFIVLPAFFVRCPYKSPTAWVCATIWDFVTLWIPHAIACVVSWLCRKTSALRWTGHIGFWVWQKCKYVDRRMAIWKPLAANWRQRDLAAIWTSPVTQTRRGDIAPLLQELLKLEQAPTDVSAEAAEPQYDVPYFRVLEDRRALHNAIRTITELPPLVRALVWVSQASQDARTQENVSRCIHALESHFVQPDPIHIIRDKLPMTQEGVRALSIWHLLSSISPDVAEALGLRDAGRSTTAIRRRAYEHCSRSPSALGGWGRLVATLNGSPPGLHVFLQLLTFSVKTIVEMLANGPFDKDPGAQLSARRVREHLGLVLNISLHQTGNTSPLQTAARHLMEALRVSDDNTHGSFESTFPGLRWHIFVAVKALCNDDPPWSLLEELHVTIPPEADYGWDDKFQKIKWRQTPPENIPLPPSASASASASASSLALVHCASGRDNESPCASSSGQRHTAGEGGQVAAGQSQDSGADSAVPGEGISGLMRNGDIAGKREGINVGQLQAPAANPATTVPRPPSSRSNGSNSNGHGGAVANGQEGTPVTVGPQDHMLENAGTATQQLVPDPDIGFSLGRDGDGEDEGEFVESESPQNLGAETMVSVSQRLSRGSVGSESRDGAHAKGDSRGKSSHSHDSTSESPQTAQQ